MARTLVDQEGSWVFTFVTPAVKIFLIGDAASCAKGHQQVPPGYYNVEVIEAIQYRVMGRRVN